MTKRAKILFVLGIAFLLISIYGLMGVLQAASLFVGVRALLKCQSLGLSFSYWPYCFDGLLCKRIPH